ncbi:MAG: hypothetical protein Q7R49_00865 [Candidatus Daviesbacteria bacterium]|nr:hypothetical protein [Candidatus Daviesbacteria bacterium]
MNIENITAEISKTLKVAGLELRVAGTEVLEGMNIGNSDTLARRWCEDRLELARLQGQTSESWTDVQAMERYLERHSASKGEN